MTKEELALFIGKVAHMRKMQKEYFSQRSGLNLTHAKNAEKEVDAILKKTLDPPATEKQASIF